MIKPTSQTSQRSAAEQALIFASPAATTLTELLDLRMSAVALQRKIKRKSAAVQSGGSVTRRLGRGLDFAEVREYQPGDDVRMIDWRVTARSGTPHTKLFVEERERPVVLLVDFRANMRFGTQGMFKSMLAARLAALLGWCAVGAHDRVGGFVFTNDWHSEVRPQSGRRGLMALFRAIDEAQQRQPSVDTNQFIKTLRRLRHGVPTGSTVVLCSDFMGFDEQARQTLGSVLHGMDMIAVHIHDRLDSTLPPLGRYPISAKSSQDEHRHVLTVGSKLQRQRYADSYLAQQQSVKQLFTQQQHRYVSISTAQSILDCAMHILAPHKTGGATGSTS